jgi:hypothetical protein
MLVAILMSYKVSEPIYCSRMVCGSLENSVLEVGNLPGNAIGCTRIL